MSHMLTANLRILQQETKQWAVHGQHANWTKYKSWHLWCYTSCRKGSDFSHCLVNTQPLRNQECKNQEIAMRSGKMQNNYLVDRKLQVMKAHSKRNTFLLLDRFQHFFSLIHLGYKIRLPRVPVSAVPHVLFCLFGGLTGRGHGMKFVSPLWFSFSDTLSSVS